MGNDGSNKAFGSKQNIPPYFRQSWQNARYDCKIKLEDREVKSGFGKVQPLPREDPKSRQKLDWLRDART
jgi:hypothetical protein